MISRKLRGFYEKQHRVDRFMAIDLDLDLIWALGLRSNSDRGSGGSGSGAGCVRRRRTAAGSLELPKMVVQGSDTDAGWPGSESM